MSRRVVFLAIAVSSPAFAETYDDADPDQKLGATIGIATGSRVTPGGLRVEANYLYQLNQDDWLEATANLTLGGGDAACFIARDGDYTCDHAIFDGKGVDVTGSIRHLFIGQAGFSPFVRAGVGVGFARFADDDVTGLALTLRGAGGIRVDLGDRFALVAEAGIALGAGLFGHGLGIEPQLGISVLAGGEFSLE